MRVIDIGPWAGNTQRLAYSLRMHAAANLGEDGICLRGPFVINVKHAALTDRPLPQKYLNAEINWYESEERNANALERYYGKIPEMWRKVMAPDGTVNSNYGWCVFSEEAGDQFGAALDVLNGDGPNEGQESRRAIMMYQRRRWREHAKEHGANDQPCTIYVHMYKTDRLNYVINMRASDAIYGFTPDIHWHVHFITEYLIQELGAEWFSKKPRIVLQTSTIQVYEKYMKHVARNSCELPPLKQLDEWYW